MYAMSYRDLDVCIHEHMHTYEERERDGKIYRKGVHKIRVREDEIFTLS